MPESTHAESPFQRGAVRGDTLAHYPVSAARFDEMCSAPGRLRPHWQYALRAFDALGAAELGRRRDEVQQVLRENGVTPLKGVIVGGGSHTLDVAVTAQRVP